MGEFLKIEKEETDKKEGRQDLHSYGSPPTPSQFSVLAFSMGCARLAQCTYERGTLIKQRLMVLKKNTCWQKTKEVCYLY